ncbi:hypothetical protein C9F11_43670 (plasmid) [Streptomyces sp. YIM 121038]|nr:hypothetical protein C9F11_43670 [Streptomyces sp. YIM 121038]
MLVYPCGLDLSSSSLRSPAARFREHRYRTGSRWRRLNVGRQALLTLAHLRNGTTHAQLAEGFRVGTSTVYRYTGEAVELLAALPPTRVAAVHAASKAYVLLDSTLLPIDRTTADRPFSSDKHTRHAISVQILADPFSRLLRVSPTLPGAIHDIRPAREHGIVDALTQGSTAAERTKAAKAPAERPGRPSAAEGRRKRHCRGSPGSIPPSCGPKW